MSHVEKHAPGAFCWVELATTDQDAAKAFYTSLFGWQFTDTPMGPDALYTMFQLEGCNAAAAYTLPDDEKSMGVPPNWRLYVNVESADATAKYAAECGGTVLAPPFDVATHGRMAVISDPTGAVFSLWEAKTHIGLGIQNQHGSFCWADLSTPNPQRAAEFYSEVFGWSMPPGDGGYLHISNGPDFIGGIPPAEHRDPHTSPHWLVYFQVDDCAAATERARELGARIFMCPMVMENVGTITVVADPQGAAFALFQPAPPK